MSILFGYITEYFPEKGFGFVRNLLAKLNSSKTFFHITTIRKNNINVYNNLLNYKPTEKLYVWYEIEKTSKGAQVSKFINHDELKRLINNSSGIFISTS